MAFTSPSSFQRAIRWHPPSHDIRVESIPIPQIEHPDDAIVKVTVGVGPITLPQTIQVDLAALCGSDLHIYRGHGGVTDIHTCGHEFIGEVVALGTNFHPQAIGRPRLYSELLVGDKVVSPFTVNCGECNFCRLGYTCRCPQGLLFGSPALGGGQAQYVRVPNAGGTLFNLTNPASWVSRQYVGKEGKEALDSLADSSLLLLADILPTGIFGALQALNHPKVSPLITGRPWPSSLETSGVAVNNLTLLAQDRTLTIVVVGLGPVGVCTCVALLDLLASKGLPFQIVAIDPLESRRAKMQAVYATINGDENGSGQFAVSPIEEAQKLVDDWTDGVGCTAVLEVVGNNSALSLALRLVRPFGVITSVGVHQDVPLPFTGAQLYSKNVSFDFGRCPARAMFPMAFDLLVKRQDVFGGVGGNASLVEKIVSFDEAVESYRLFDRGECGKVVFDPWK